jgi:hypothetical protein
MPGVKKGALVGGGEYGFGLARAPAEAQSGASAVAASADAVQQVSRERVASAAIDLGPVRLDQSVLAIGATVGPRTYDIRVTAEIAQPEVAGQAARLERWAGFFQNGEEKGPEMVTIVPGSDINEVAKESPPAPGHYRVDMLKVTCASGSITTAITSCFTCCPHDCDWLGAVCFGGQG